MSSPVGEALVDGDEGVCLQFAHGEVLSFEGRLPSLLACDLPGGTSLHPVTKQPDLDLREALVPSERNFFGDLAFAHSCQEQ